VSETILQEAQRIVHGERPGVYGHPLDNHGCTSEMMAAYLFRKYGIRVPLVAEDTAIWNILQKISREANAAKRDNRVDGAGYFGNVQMIEDERERRASHGHVNSHVHDSAPVSASTYCQGDGCAGECARCDQPPDRVARACSCPVFTEYGTCSHAPKAAAPWL
jgi:hypothetical protein